MKNWDNVHWQNPGCDGEDRVICVFERGKRRTVAHVYGKTEKERDANARLVSSAPALLVACKAALKDSAAPLGQTTLSADVHELINAAICSVEEE